MPSKKTKAAKRAAAQKSTQADGNAAPNGSSATTASDNAQPNAGSSGTSPASEPDEDVELEDVEEEDIMARAEKVKEKGNVAFKAGRYGDAIDSYTKAIEMSPTEPSYLTNRAASYMALKKYRPALEDCQAALSIQAPQATESSNEPPPIKTLLRLARCQLALGQPTPALSTLKPVLLAEPKNAQALQLKSKITELEGHLKTLSDATLAKNWGLARLALDKCLQGIEGEGAEVPVEWRLWRVEFELAKGSWEAANNAANDALRLNPNSPEILTSRAKVLFLGGRLPLALQHLQSALRFDPSFEPAQRLRKRIKEVERLKEEGNSAFKRGGDGLDEAVTKYSEALEFIGEADEEGKGGQIRATLLSNRATTLVKLSRYEEAMEDTDTSLSLTPNSFKALRTRARISMHLEKFDGAVADFTSAIKEAKSDGSVNASEIRQLEGELKKAQVALKQSKTKDYYKILGIARDCDDRDIKKAYRRESLLHHPDKGGDAEKFKLVAEAYNVLSDPDRRARYDAGDDDDDMMGGHSHGFPAGFSMSPDDINRMFGGGFGGSFGGGGFGGGGFSSGGFSSGGRQGFGGRGGFPF